MMATSPCGFPVLIIYGNALLTFINYQEPVRDDPNNAYRVTLMLHDAIGQAWSVSLSADCLRFIGRYKRLEGFDIDAALRVEGISRQA
jgi:hypothetical protein